jgi:hypothetical protein
MSWIRPGSVAMSARPILEVLRFDVDLRPARPMLNAKTVAHTEINI